MIYELSVRPAPGSRETFNPYKVEVEALTGRDAELMVKRQNPGCQVWLTGVNQSSSNNSSSSSDSGTDFATGVFQLVGWGITTTATVGYLGVTKVAYPATKFVVTKAIVPATVFTGKYTWKGMKYVTTTTVPQVYSFTKNTVVPGVIKVANDIVTFIKELIQKVLNK